MLSQSTSLLHLCQVHCDWNENVGGEEAQVMRIGSLNPVTPRLQEVQQTHLAAKFKLTWTHLKDPT